MKTTDKQVEAFRAWARKAGQGEKYEYYRGHLSYDRHRNPTVSALAGVARGMWDCGRAHLVQQRVDKNRWAYLAVAK